MGDLTAISNPTARIGPIFVSVQQAAEAMNIAPWSMYKLLDSGAIESRYQGRRRLVLVESLYEYARNLPTVPESA
jgi:hypothetical protein